MKNLTTTQMVAEYNKLTGKSIKKFSSREQGEKQLEAARIKFAPVPEAKPKKEKPVWPFGEPSEQKKEVVKEPKKKPKKEVVSGRSESIAASWTDKNVAASRSQRDHVEVAGVEYRSVAAAFLALNLPMGKHIKFRADLKAAGKGEIDGHKFKIAKSS